MDSNDDKMIKCVDGKGAKVSTAVDGELAGAVMIMMMVHRTIA